MTRRSKAPAELVLVNRAPNPQAVGSTVIASGAKYALSESDLANERLMVKLAHAEKLGLIEWL